LFQIKNDHRSDARGRGIGRMLVEAFIGESKRLGFIWIYLDTSDAQQDAVRLYQKIGFKNIGETGDISDVIGPYIPSDLHGVKVVKFLLKIDEKTSK
jgi:L-amino acid N-acyltransferase YncA